ncbi:MAG: NAD-dependent DNA ligase LigA [Prevotella sp.]|nr:NAD-dependent DNA ligase LigA [Prevotella sp.]
MTEELRLRMQQLTDELNRASDAYYNGRPELMSDHEWDARFDELKRLEEETGVTLPDSPTQRVSEDNTAGQKEAHEFPALSLAKTKQVAEVVKWAEGKAVWISWKLDGLTLVATYDRGRLTKVVTRGNGHIGTNITHLTKYINGIPQTIGNQEHIVIRGEAIISYQDFQQFLLESGEDYANPRNLASGSLSLKDPEEVKDRKIRWVAFSLVFKEGENSVEADGKTYDLNRFGDRMAWLDALGFNTVDRELVENPTVENVQAAIDRFTFRVTTTGSERMDFPADGLVVTYDDAIFAATGSVTGHHATRAGLAFKWQDEAAETELLEIEWSCAASTISPVAIFRPVELEGTTVKRASLCNISECERLGIGGAGTKIEVIKANKIIPKVINVVEAVGELQIPTQCPVCQHVTEIVESQQSGTRTLHCTNPVCPAKQLKKYARFVSKAGVDIDGISEQTLAKFISLGWISDFSDIYRLPEHAREIALLDGFGERSAANIVKSIEKARRVDAQRLLIALSIPKCGADVAKRLLQAYSFDELVETASTTDNSDFFAHIDGIGPERSALIVEWFHNEDNILITRKLLNYIQVIQQEQNKSENLKGMTFVITGETHHFKNRKALQDYIESQGGRVAGSVSGSTSFLINNDIESTSGKNKKAKELGIEIISEETFLERFASAENETKSDENSPSEVEPESNEKATESQPQQPKNQQLSLDF